MTVSGRSNSARSSSIATARAAALGKIYCGTQPFVLWQEIVRFGALAAGVVFLLFILAAVLPLGLDFLERRGFVTRAADPSDRRKVLVGSGEAARRLAAEAAAGRLDPDGITSDLLARHLSLAHLPEPDLFIRTGGEQRVSNFLLWHLAYTELYFTDTLWPDFDRACMGQALESFAGRQRRFGRTGDQVEQIKGA